MRLKKHIYKNPVWFSGRRGRRIYIKYLLLLAGVLAICVLLDHYARKQALPGADGDSVQTEELAGYLQVVPLTPEETRALIVERLGTYLTAEDIEWLFQYLALGEMPDTVSQELEAVGSGYVPRGTWCAVFEEMLGILGLQDEVEILEIQYLGMLLEDGHLMADSGNYLCDTESIDFVYGESYRVYVSGNILLGRAAGETEGGGETASDADTGEEAETAGISLPETVRVLVTQDNGGKIYRENVYLKGDTEVQIFVPEGTGTQTSEAEAGTAGENVSAQQNTGVDNGQGEGGTYEAAAAGTVVDCLAWMTEKNASEIIVSSVPSGENSTDGGDSANDGDNAAADESGAWTDAKSLMAAGRISITDGNGTAAASGYTGSLHIYKDENGLRVVNETLLEAYLCGVVPGEMPESFELEALKAQAVCARTYAARLVFAEKYEAYGADVNDTTDCQVYLPSAENDKATEAVAATAGQVMIYGEELAVIYYFSTSCGLTSGLEVWQQESLPYLSVVSLLTGASSQASSADSGLYPGGAASYDDFLRRTDISSYDSHSRYFRWTAALDPNSRLSEVKAALQEEIEKGSGRIGVEDTAGTGIASVENLGGFSCMEVVSRNEAGMITDLALVFAGGRVHLYHENVIRTVLAAAMTALTDKNGESVNTVTMLPSAAFSVEAADGQILLYGGGLGHGIGMSQYGADGMAQAGMEYTEILGMFFSGARVRESK